MAINPDILGSDAEAIEKHARNVRVHAAALLMLTRECNDDEVLQAAESIVLELRDMLKVQQLELEEILPTEECVDCKRPCIEFRRCRLDNKVTCIACLLDENKDLEPALRRSLIEREREKAARDAANLPPVAERDEPVIPHVDVDTKPSAHTRASVLEAARHATQQREVHHGTPSDTFTRIADLWATILGLDVRAHHVALCLTAVKIARAVEDPAHGDNWVDIAGYGACGGEVASARRSA